MIVGAPQLIILLVLVPLLAGLAGFAAYRRRRRLREWADPHLWLPLAPNRSGALRAFRNALFLVALAFALIAAIRPQVGAKLVQVDRRGIDVLVILDVSLSMEATDVVPNRLERSKQEVRELMGGLRGDRVGILIFSGTAFLLCPLTLDIAAANMFLDAVSVDALPDPGTNLESALRGAQRAFETDTASGARAVILFTDGEGHEGGPVEVAEALGKSGVPVVAVGVGTPRGEPIPLRDERGNLSGYKKDRAGNVVLSRLDEGILREIAAVSKGAFYPATLQGHEIAAIREFLQRLERGELGGALRRRVDERFQIPAGVALIFLVLALLVPEARRSARRPFRTLGLTGGSR
jgi:Ca-activated chloride channel family protein